VTVTLKIEPAPVRLEHVTKRFGSVVAVDDVSLDIVPGSLVTLLGPSGCGKTTALRMIAGLEGPTSGRVYIDGVDVTSLPASARDVTMMFQSYALFPHLNVYENVVYGLRVLRRSDAEVRRRAAEILALVGLTGLEHRAPGQLSGGQQQRVALARALIMNPKVLLFDEPLSNLDAKLRKHVRTEIRVLQQRLGITSVYVTHDQAEALAISDRVVVMNKGRIEQIGTPRELYRQPATRFVAEFIGEANFIPGTVERGVLRLADHAMPAPDGAPTGAVLVMARPDVVEIAPEGPGLAGRVESRFFVGEVSELLVQTAAGPIEVRSDFEDGPGVGDRVFLRFPANRIVAYADGQGM
jgi:iron(III) transport system ATP-binding protein